MTPQEIFDSAMRHLIAQPRMAGTIKDAGYASCAYRMNNGDKCIVGAFIPDCDYRKEMDLYGDVTNLVSELERRDELPPSMVWMMSSLDILTDLQNLHDNIANWQNRDEMRVSLLSLARKYDLKTDLINAALDAIFGDNDELSRQHTD